jgi:hypothetical protein
MIRARTYLVLTGLLLVTLTALLMRGEYRSRQFAAVTAPPLARLGATLGLTDLAIWTEARYTRHPSQADRFAAFQDLPGAFDHFPAGSIVAPPPVATIR